MFHSKREYRDVIHTPVKLDQSKASFTVSIVAYFVACISFKK